MRVQDVRALYQDWAQATCPAVLIGNVSHHLSGLRIEKTSALNQKKCKWSVLIWRNMQVNCLVTKEMHPELSLRQDFIAQQVKIQKHGNTKGCGAGASMLRDIQGGVETGAVFLEGNLTISIKIL